MTDERKKYEEYKAEIQRNGPDELRAKLNSGDMSRTYKVNAANRALREHEEAIRKEAQQRHEAREEQKLELQREANEIAKKGSWPVRIQILLAAGMFVIGAIGLYFNWAGLALNAFRTLMGR